LTRKDLLLSCAWTVVQTIDWDLYKELRWEQEDEGQTPDLIDALVYDLAALLESVDELPKE
jgi:hypothetical protein